MADNITLAEFYKISPNPLFLNFTALNFDKATIKFMNKNNTPKMPVWAAIVAATSLPFLF
jgi:hypothetical protein